MFFFCLSLVASSLSRQEPVSLLLPLGICVRPAEVANSLSFSSTGILPSHTIAIPYPYAFYNYSSCHLLPAGKSRIPPAPPASSQLICGTPPSVRVPWGPWQCQSHRLQSSQRPGEGNAGVWGDGLARDQERPRQPSQEKRVLIVCCFLVDLRTSEWFCNVTSFVPELAG